MSFAKDCKKLFKTVCLYEILNLDKANCSSLKQNDIKKAYYKASLVYHPDRSDASEKNVATKKFQILSKAYSILSDKKKKVAYDETGEIDDEMFDVDESKDWLAYWRLLFKKVTPDDIKNFELKYKESDEEKADLKATYLKYEGDMTQILGSIFCSTIDDEERFKNLILGMISKSEVPAFDAFTKESKKKKMSRKRKADNEAKEAEKLAAEILGKKELDESSLHSLISKKVENRGKQLNSFLDGLAEKYTAKPGKKLGDKKGGRK